MVHQFSLAKNNFYNIPTEIGDQLPRFKFWVRFLNLYSKASFAMTVRPPLVHDALQQLWTSAVPYGSKSTPYGFKFTIEGQEFEVTESVFNRVLGFAVRDTYDPEPTVAERLKFFEEIGCYPITGQISSAHIQKQYFHVEWNYFFEAITRCFRARERDYHQIPIPMQIFAVSLALERDINYGRIILAKIVGTMGSAESRDIASHDVLCWYPRFMQMVINHLVPSSIRQTFARSITSASLGMGTKSLTTIANQDKHHGKPMTIPENFRAWMVYDAGVTSKAGTTQVSSHAQNPSAHNAAFEGIPEEHVSEEQGSAHSPSRSTAAQRHIPSAEQGSDEGNLSLHTTDTSSSSSDSEAQDSAIPQDLTQGESHISTSDSDSSSLSPLLGVKRPAPLDLGEGSDESDPEVQPLVRKRPKISHAATSSAQSHPRVSSTPTPLHVSGSPRAPSTLRESGEDFVPAEEPVASVRPEVLFASPVPSPVRSDAAERIGSPEHSAASQPEIQAQEITEFDPLTATNALNQVSAGTAFSLRDIIQDIHECETGRVCESLGREGSSSLRPESERQTQTERSLERGHLDQTQSLELNARMSAIENQMKHFGQSMGQLGMNVGDNKRALDDYAARMSSQSAALTEMSNKVNDLGHAGGVLGSTLYERMGAVESVMHTMATEVSRLMYAFRHLVPPECYDDTFYQPPPDDGDGDAGGAGGAGGAGTGPSGLGGSHAAGGSGTGGDIQDNSPKGEREGETREQPIAIDEEELALGKAIEASLADLEKQASPKKVVDEAGSSRVEESEPVADEEAQRKRKGKAVVVEHEEPFTDFGSRQEDVHVESDSEEDVPLAQAIKRSLLEQGGGAGVSTGEAEEIPVDEETLKAQQLALEQAQFFKMKMLQDKAAFFEKQTELKEKQYDHELARLADPQIDLDKRRIGQKWDEARKILMGTCTKGVNNKETDDLFYNLNLQNPLTVNYINALKAMISRVRVGYNAMIKEWQVILSLVDGAPMSFMYVDDQFMSRRSASELFLLATKIQYSQAEELSILYRDQLMQLKEDKGPEFSANPDIV